MELQRTIMDPGPRVPYCSHMTTMIAPEGGIEPSMWDTNDHLAVSNIARLAGVFYVLDVASGSAALFATGALRDVAMVMASGFYLVVTVALYLLFVPVHRRLSAIAAAISACGCLVSLTGVFLPAFAQANPLPLFGVYCLLLANLIARGRFFPRFLAGLLVIGGLGWLTFANPWLTDRLQPYNMLPGVIAETILAVWLIWPGPRHVRPHE